MSRFYCRFPKGANYFTLAENCELSALEKLQIFDFLKKGKFIKKYDRDFNYIITSKGRSVLTRHKGIENFLQNQKDEDSTFNKNFLYFF